MAANAASFFLDGVTVTARNAQYTGTPFTDIAGDGSYNTYLGGNRAGSCAPGIGIATTNGQCKLGDWTVEDQHEAARDPQDSQHIAHDGLGAGESGVGDTPINAWDVADLNDTFSLTVEATGWVQNEVV